MSQVELRNHVHYNTDSLSQLFLITIRPDFLLVDLREFVIRFRVAGTKKK